MNLLIVSSFNSGKISPFVEDQLNELKKHSGINVFYFGIKGRGVIGYLKNLNNLNILIRDKSIDLIHAHYGLSGMLCNLQRRIPVIITFHGSDVNQYRNLLISILASKMAQFSIITNRKLLGKLKPKKYAILPCGINKEQFYPIDKKVARDKLGITNRYILFSSSFDRKVKNSNLAKQAIQNVEEDIELKELKGYTKEEVNLLINGAELVLVTSKSETGPLIVKEAIATNTPIVSTDVGDVKELIGNIDNCFVTAQNAIHIAKCIESVLNGNLKCDGKEIVESFDNERIVNELVHLYKEVIAN